MVCFESGELQCWLAPLMFTSYRQNRRFEVFTSCLCELQVYFFSCIYIRARDCNLPSCQVSKTLVLFGLKCEWKSRSFLFPSIIDENEIDYLTSSMLLPGRTFRVRVLEKDI